LPIAVHGRRGAGSRAVDRIVFLHPFGRVGARVVVARSVSRAVDRDVVARRVVLAGNRVVVACRVGLAADRIVVARRVGFAVDRVVVVRRFRRAVDRVVVALVADRADDGPARCRVTFLSARGLPKREGEERRTATPTLPRSKGEPAGLSRPSSRRLRLFFEAALGRYR